MGTSLLILAVYGMLGAVTRSDGHAVKRLTGWLNDFDQYLNFRCPYGQAMNELSSYHNNYHEDRRWRIGCKPISGLTSNCFWSGYVNDWDEVISYTCGSQALIAGVKSEHRNYHEDRRMDFLCCRLQGTLTNCAISANMNNFDGPLNYEVPSNRLLYGVVSWHNNYHEDRIFRFVTCEKA